VGIVEKVGHKGKRAFTNLDELWEILNSPKGTLSRPMVRWRKKKSP
jgi:hypothetical protein